VLIVRSPVRISFGGGGTDLPAYYEQFGGAVLSVAINKYFYTILRTRNDDRIQVISSDLRVFETWQDIANKPIQGSELEIPLAVLKEVGCNISVDLFLASEIPPGTGLGSSASVCVNILKTLTNYVQKPLSKYALAEQAFHIARNVLGKHVGKQDEYAAAFGGLNYISFHGDDSTHVEPIDLDSSVLQELQSNLMLFFTGSAHHSWTILREQENSTRSHSSSTVEALHEVKELGEKMRAVLESGHLQRFRELTNSIDWLGKTGRWAARLLARAEGGSFSSTAKRAASTPYVRHCRGKVFTRWLSLSICPERRSLSMIRSSTVTKELVRAGCLFPLRPLWR
jgi:D-glycero-alpha-D-manno-heptose-7-phosphate kinase